MFSFAKKIIGLLLAIMVIIAVGKFLIFSTYTEDKKYGDVFRDKYQVFSIDMPKSLEFAGEKVPLSDFEVYERMDRELLVNTYWQSQTLLMHKRANRWLPIIIPILRQNGIPEDFKYLPLVETGFLQATSPAGAVGFWQFVENTAQYYGLEINNEVDERYNVQKSTIAACNYIKDLKDKLGSWTMAAAAYNMGLSNAQKQVQKQKTVNYYDLLLNTETSRYIFRVLAIKEIIEHPEKYGYIFRDKDLYMQIPTYTVLVDTPVSNLTDFAISMHVNYKILKTFNPWLRESFLTNAEKKTYYIELPKEGYKNLAPFENDMNPIKGSKEERNILQEHRE